MQTLCRFAQVKEQFRRAETESLLSLYDPKALIQSITTKSPFSIINFTNPENARKVLDRSSLMLYMTEYLCQGNSFNELLSAVEELNDDGFFEKWRTSSFRFEVDCFGKSLEQNEQVDLINNFAFMTLDGPISLKKPQVTFLVAIDHPHSLYSFGIKLGESLRGQIDNFSLKKRMYLGTTSMEAELSFVMCNLARITPGQVVYDPFVGTGSILYIAAYLGAFTIGSDIDGRQLRGTTKGKIHSGQSLKSNLEQYGLEMTAGLVFDFTQHPWREGEWFDAIVCDPPYGIRAGAKRIARTEQVRNVPKELYNQLYPTTKPYDIDDLVPDLLQYAFQFIKPGGRLVFWYPEDSSEDKISEFPKRIHKLNGMQFLYAMPQKIQHMIRWLMVYEKEQKQ